MLLLLCYFNLVFFATFAYLQQDSAVGVYVRPGVLGLALLQQYVGDNLIQLRHQSEHGIVGKFLQGKLSLAGVARVCLSQHGMAVTRDDLKQRETTGIKTHRVPATECNSMIISKDDKDRQLDP